MSHCVCMVHPLKGVHVSFPITKLKRALRHPTPINYYHIQLRIETRVNNVFHLCNICYFWFSLL